MNHSVDSSDRRPGEYVLFAMVFFGLLSAAGSVVLNSPPMALFFAIMLVLVVSCFLIGRVD